MTRADQPGGLVATVEGRASCRGCKCCRKQTVTASVQARIDKAWADSKQPCDCIDCDGEWCVWCLAHHGKKLCPFAKSHEKELREECRLLESNKKEASHGLQPDNR